MASRMNTKVFFAEGTPNQYDFTLTQYDQALRLKAESKSSKPENVIKLDKWYQNELPKKIKSRGKDAHLVHDELVQTIKWKLARGKFRPNLVNLVQMNTPRVVMQDTKKAFRKLVKTGDLQAAAQSLSTLKGVGPGMASAVLAAGAPHIAPFMADECLLSMPEVDGLDYTMKEYMRYVDYVKECVERLNSQCPSDPNKYTPHTVELAVWTHYILYDLKPELLEDMPEAKVDKNATSAAAAAPAAAPAAKPEVAEEPSENNGQVSAAISADEDTKSSMASSVDEDSNSAKNHNNTHSAETNAETPSTVPVESEAPVVPESTPEVAAVENGNKINADSTPKTNGNNSHSNGSTVPEVAPISVPETAPLIAKEQDQQNGAIPVAEDTAANNEKIEAKVSEVEPQPNGELENGVKSSEKESTDLRSTSPASVKRSLDEVEVVSSEATLEQPSAKKLKTCEENAAPEAVGAATEAAAATPAPTTPAAATPQVAV